MWVAILFACPVTSIADGPVSKLTEALSNAMLYGNASDPAKRVRVDVMVNDARISARVTDEGVGFDPRTIEDPTIPENITRPGGRGLFLMRELLDEVSYNDQGNSVTLILRLDGTASFDEAASA